MAKDEKPAQRAASEDQQAKPDQPKKPGRWKRLLGKTWLVLLIVGLLSAQGVGFWYFGVYRTAKKSPSAELTLGQFRFIAESAEAGDVSRADFSLHIRLLNEVATPARRQLEDRKFKVQQDIEELLRQARSGDFVEPTLTGLKRRVQEQVNASLGMRALAGVIITDLKLERASEKPPAGAVAGRAEPRRGKTLLEKR
ncbi:MAG: flagellar basal body-associated FliL family protein [Pirellulales bacterium]